MIKFKTKSPLVNTLPVSLCVALMLCAMPIAMPIAMTLVSAQNSDIEKCMSVDNDIARLLCYDALFGRVQATPQKAVVPAPPPVATLPKTAPDKTLKAAPQLAPIEEDFGAEQLSKKEDKVELREIQETVSSVSENSRGLRTFILANGQHWRETESSRLRIKVGQEVVVKKGAFSAYYMKKPDSGRTVRVQRIN